jgi:hypothetical protein
MKLLNDSEESAIQGAFEILDRMLCTMEAGENINEYFTQDEIGCALEALCNQFPDLNLEISDPTVTRPSEEIGDGMTDVEADADTLRSAGWGTDEDYE